MKRGKTMEKYERANLEIIYFDSKDVISTSTPGEGGGEEGEE